MTTIKGSTNSEGLFTPINPYDDNYVSLCGTYEAKRQAFDIMHPPLPLYNQEGELVKGLNDVEVTGPVWQYKFAGDDDFQNSTLYHKFKTFEDYKNRPNGAESRQIYLTVPPTEKTLQAKQPWQDIVNELSKPITKADAQPVKEVCIICDEETANKEFCADCGLNKADERPVSKEVKTAEEIAKNEWHLTLRGWQIKKTAQRNAYKDAKSPGDHLNEAANNLGYVDFQTMLSLEEDSVIEPIVLARMEIYASQFATEAGGDKPLPQPPPHLNLTYEQWDKLPKNVQELYIMNCSEDSRGSLAINYFQPKYVTITPNNLVDVEEVIKVLQTELFMNPACQRTIDKIKSLSK